MKCGECRYMRQDGGNKGRCVRYAPGPTAMKWGAMTVYEMRDDEPMITHWPYVYDDDYCGEFEEVPK